MFRNRLFALLTAVCCLVGLSCSAAAAEVDCDSVYCFSDADFSGETGIAGICITSLPDKAVGSVMLGSRVLAAGDVLTAGQVSQMTFSPRLTGADKTAEVGYLPIYPEGVAAAAAMTIGIRGKENKPPVAQDAALETYKNLAVDGKLKVTDPEGEAMTFAVTRQPKRGAVTLRPDGGFTYTPKKNKVGVDSFTFTASDASGKISREATVTITILKPTDSTQYTDTVGRECRFTAEWMKNTGIFEGENVAGNTCFSPDKEVSRGEFITMLVKTLDIPVEEDLTGTGYTDEIPGWLQPYLAAAMRAGLTAGLPDQQTFGADEIITGAEAGVMLKNALDLTASVSAEAGEAAMETDVGEDEIPAWAQNALTAVTESGFVLEANKPLTREAAAEILYHAAQMDSEKAAMGRM
ncbi:MAG: Ig-like domain-containing protein [Faecousia sp.]